MIKIKDLLPLFEQTAARRAHEAHHLKVTAALTPMRHGLLTDAHCTQMDQARAIYLREYRRHNLWLKRRFENAGLKHLPYAPA